jgi:hypothetical protein
VYVSCPDPNSSEDVSTSKASPAKTLLEKLYSEGTRSKSSSSPGRDPVLFVSCYRGNQSYELQPEQSDDHNNEQEETDDRLISLESSVRGLRRRRPVTTQGSRTDAGETNPAPAEEADVNRTESLGTTSTGGGEWLDGLDFEADLAQAVLDSLGVEMIDKREGPEDGEEEEE